ncbi:protein SON isoform X1 [Python bivittatus]|uniref:Protein SON isoform X1 n=1 Tax=Python bivittatus TaxID=176946 RepID=A0A9F3VZW9_PYTBI|nr:protein SON isoform X5 [Python bivittatus]XP_015743387.1 protein SON isoform X1 [Python bivittatus]
MATNIEQIFRSFVVTKFREIQEQQFGSGKIGNQHNGEINTSGQVNSSDDTVQSIESLQNESLVQKIEQVLSEVLGTEPRYKSGDGEDIERNNSRSTKRGLSEEVQDEIPRKKSKKDKKHKDKKKKKKRKKEKKEKKYKKHAKEIDVQQKECGDMQLISHSNLENSGSLLNAENDMDKQSGSTLKEVSTWINEKTAYENLNSAVLNNVFSSDTSKLDTSEEDSTLINIQEVIEVKLTNDKELENDTCQSNVTVNICTEGEFLSGAVCTVVEGVSDIKEMEQTKLMLEATDQESVPETSPHCVIREPEHLETRVESAAVEVTSINSVTESVTSKSLKQTIPTSFETTGYKLMTLPLESNVEAKDSVTTLGFLAMVVGKDFEATSEFLNTAKVKASERSPKHTSRKSDPVHDSEKTLTMKDLHKPLTFGTERKDLETAPEAVHAIPEKDFEPAVVAQLKPQQKVSEFDVQKYSRASLGTEILTEMKEFREPEVSTLMMELSESEKTARYLPVQRDAKDLKRTPLLENMTRIDSEEHLSVELLERKNLDVASDFMEIDTKCLRAKSDGVTESENWNTVPESLKAKEVKNLEYPQEFEKAEQINYLETSLETAIENRGNSEIAQRSLALFNVKVPENTSQLRGVTVSETIMETEIVKTQNLEGSKYVDLRNKENENVEKWKNIPESLMTVNNLENTSSELQCIEEIKIVKETSQSDTEAQKKDFKSGLEPEGEREKRDVDAGSESLQMIFANYSEHSLELYTETEGMMELKNSEAVLKSLHKQDADNFESLCTKEMKYIKNTESEAVTGANDLQENLKPLHKHVKNVETASESIALPIMTYMETVQGISNRKRNETESHFVQEVEQKCSDSTDFVKKNQTGAETTDLGLTSRYKEVIKTDSRRIRESELSKSQGPLFISKSLHEKDVISSENNQSKGIAVVQDLKEFGKSLAAAIDPKEFFKLKNVVSVESDFPFGSTVKQFESVSESLEEQNLELLEHTKTQLRKVCLDSVPDLEIKHARTSSEILYSDEFHIQEEKQKLEEKIETTGLMEASEPVHLSERDLIVPTSDSATIDSEYGPESMYLAETNSENILKSYKIQVKDSKTTSESMILNVKDLKIDSEPLLQAGVEIREYLLGHKSVLTSDSVQLTPETPRKNEMLPESQGISGLPKSGTMLRSEGLTHAHLKIPPACIRVMDTEVVEITPKSKELEVIEKQEGVLTSLFPSVESTDVLEESFERMYTTDVNKVEASQKSINVESIGKEKMNDEHIQPVNENDANISETFMSSKHTVRAQIIEDILSAANKENVSVITPESSGELVLKYSEVSETITGLERENCDTTLPEFMVDVQDLEESSSILDAGEMKNLKAIQIENYAKSLRALESGDAADLSQSGSKVEPKSLRKTMSYERLLEIKDPVATAAQLKTPASTSSESVSILEVTDTSKISELKTSQTYLGVSDVKSSGTTAEKYLLEIIDSDSQMQAENILEVKHTESSSEIKYGLRTHPFKTASESEKVTQDKASKTISDILCSGSVENLEQILESKHNQEGKDLDSHLMAKDLKGGLTYEEIIGISETTTQFSSVVEATDTGSNISSIVPETVEKCPETFLENINVSDTQGTNTNVELDNLLKQKSTEVTTDVKNLKPNSESNNAVESVHMKDLEDFEAVPVCKSVVEIKNLQVVQTSGDKEQMDFQELSKSVLPLDTQDLERNSSFQLLPQQKNVESSLEPVKDFVSVSECLSAKDIEQHLKCVSVAQESTVEHVILRQDKSAEIIPQFTLEVKDSEATLESLCVAKRKDVGETAQTSSKEQATVKPPCMTVEDNVNQLEIIVLGGSEEAVKPVHLAENKDIKVGEYIEAKDSVTGLESEVIVKDKDLEASLQDSSKYQDSDAALNSSDIIKESEGSNLRDKKSEKISSKSKDKSKSGKKAKKSRSKSPSKSKKRKKKSRSRSTSRQVSSRRARSRSKNDSSSKRKHSTSRHKSRSKSVDKKEEKESSLRSRRRRSRTSDRLKSRSKSADRRETSIRSRRRRSRSSDHKSRSRSVDKRESARRRRRLSRSSDNRRSRSRSVDRRETLTRSRRRRSRSSDRHKSRSRSGDKRETSVRTRRRRSQSSDTRKSRSRSVDRRESSIRTRRRRSRSSDNHKSRSRSPDDKREPSVRTRRRRSRTPDTRKSRSRSVDRREISGRGRRRRSRSSDNHKSRSVSVDKRESSARIRRRRSRSSDNRRSKSKSVDKRETSVRMKRRRSVSSDRKSRSRSIDKRETSARSKRRRSRSSDNHKSRSKSVENIETATKRRRSKSTDHKSRTKSVEKGELTSKSRHRRSKSSDRPRSKSKSRSKSSERRKDKDSLDGSRGKRSKYRSKSKSLEKTDGTDSVEATLNNREKSAEQHKSKSRSRSKSIDKTGERERLRRSRSKGSKSSESRSRRRRTVSRSRRNRSRSLTRKRTTRSKSDHRSQSRSRTRSRSCSRRWRRTRSRSVSRQRSLSRKRRRRSRRNRSRSTDRRRRRSDSRDSYRISLRLRSRSRTPVRLRCSRSTGRRRSTSKSPDHRRSRSSSRSPKRLTDLDKAQLLEIAKANAAAMCAKAGVPLPPSLMPVITPEKKEEKVTQKSAKETILELTEKCKKIAQSQEDDVIVNKPHVSDEEEEEHPFINHPFKLNEPKPIFFNLTTPTIKPAAPKNQVTLTKEFPVSSGSQHRKKEADSAYGEWVPVEKNKDENKDDVFPNPANLEPVDISSALNERTIAQKRLTENTFDLEAMCLLNRAQERIDAWAELNSIPGHFTGSTGAQVLSSEQLSNSGPQAWVKKDQFLRAAPVTGGMGAQLMRKMGWREGEGLGKNKEGNKEPILVDFKTDRKGLVAVGEKTQKRHGPFSTVKDLSGKHPVSALLEVCNKRRWSPPVFVLVNDNRPEYRKHFLFKVMVNGVEHKPSFVSPNKKHAKATAATVALQALGLVPKELLANATSFRSASHN